MMTCDLLWTCGMNMCLFLLQCNQTWLVKLLVSWSASDGQGQKPQYQETKVWQKRTQTSGLTMI